MTDKKEFAARLREAAKQMHLAGHEWQFVIDLLTEAADDYDPPDAIAYCHEGLLDDLLRIAHQDNKFVADMNKRLSDEFRGRDEQRD